jgi:DNA-binding winged helix-turn-helix (wHTH) protein
MPAKRAEPQFVRFGEFALDLRSGELSKNGSRLLLPVQPFRILALLVRLPGTLVTRDELRRELWRDDTFVDFEHSLNAAIKRLRQALGDPAATPRFIETLPRRGYRFRAPVDVAASTQTADAPVNAPYALLARYYDVLCGYAATMNRHARKQILRTVLPKVQSVCDVGCGSGETALDLARRGLEVHAVDSSPVFCAVVRASARRAKLRVVVHCDDMRDFTLPRPVDLVLAEFASLNNLADRRDLSRVFDSVARALRDGGWFCFDVNTPRSLRTQYPQTFWIEDKRFKLVQHGLLEADGRRARLDFEWLVPSGRLFRHVRETLWHVCWTDAEIRRALRAAGFDLVRSFDGLDVRPMTAGEERGTDAYYLARKTRRKTRAAGSGPAQQLNGAL